jgi:2-haloacid dehalogenase
VIGMSDDRLRATPITTVLLDVNETLTDLAPLEAWMLEQGLPAGSASAWLAAVLRDGLAATLTGAPASFGALGRSALRQLLADRRGGEADAERAAAAVEQLTSVVAAGRQRGDVAPGIRRLLDSGRGVATLTNGGIGVAQGLLARLGLDRDGIGTLSVDGTRTWKPHTEAYLGACDRLGSMPEQTALVACHPWDIIGAQKAGLLGVWVPRGRSWPEGYAEPHRTVESLEQVAEALDT